MSCADTRCGRATHRPRGASRGRPSFAALTSRRYRYDGLYTLSNVRMCLADYSFLDWRTLQARLETGPDTTFLMCKFDLEVRSYPCCLLRPS